MGVTEPWLSLSWGVSWHEGLSWGVGWHEGLGSQRPQGTCTCLGWLPRKPRPYVEGLPTGVPVQSGVGAGCPCSRRCYGSCLCSLPAEDSPCSTPVLSPPHQIHKHAVAQLPDRAI